jgi:hypothetical protein
MVDGRTESENRPMKGGQLSERDVAGLQAVYYLGTGVWPLLHRRSFERLTGKKTDFWLAQTVGVTVMSIGAALAQAKASTRRTPPPELRTVACASAAGLALIDVIFVARRQISAVYLLDAAAELAFLGAWAFTDSRRR